MSNSQKLIKYFAIILAILIIGAIISGIYSLGVFISSYKKDKIDNNDNKIIYINKEIKEIEADINIANVEVIYDNSFRVESTSSNINIIERDNKLVIEENDNFTKDDNYNLKIYIPFSYVLNKFKLDTEGGKVIINNLKTNYLNLDLGAGTTDITNLSVFSFANIEGGAGNIYIKNSDINNLSIEMGVGNLSLGTKLSGNNKIIAAVGDIEVNLFGTKEDYKIKANEGLGDITLDKEKIQNGNIYGTGNTNLDIDGAVGNIKIKYVN